MNPLERPIVELAADVASGKVSAESLVQASLERIDRAKDYHAILETNPKALHRAREIDQAIAGGQPAGRLAGIPFIAKDNFLTLNTHTTAASNILKPFRAPYQATVIEKLEAEGAILIAKANLDAFAHGSSTENSDFGPTKNPWNSQKVPGGSSGGSAAGVALGLASFALGTDTGGSIRLPASFCGVVGLKPTYGLVSRSGVIAMASSTDCIGPLTRSVADSAVVLGVMAGRDPLDATTIEREDSYGQTMADLKGLRVGLIKEYQEASGLEPAVAEQIAAFTKKLEATGASVSQVSIPEVNLALACYYIIVPAEISSNLERYDGIKYGHSAKEAKSLAETYDLSRDQGFGAEAKRRILIGNFVLSSGYYNAYYKQAQAARGLLIKAFEQAYKSYDILISPTAGSSAFELGAKSGDPLAMYATDLMTVSADLTGDPAISLPLGQDSTGLPLGLQLMAPQRQDAKLLAVAQAVEELANFTAKPEVKL